MDPLTAAMKVAASGMSAQSERLRVVSENLANSQSTGRTPGSDPYRRKTISFAAELDRDTGATFVGEPTGGGVETYGDTFPVALPTLGWTVHVAARYHERRKSRNDRRLAVAPDLRVELTSAQYFAGRDPVLERALRGL